MNSWKSLALVACLMAPATVGQTYTIDNSWPFGSSQAVSSESSSNLIFAGLGSGIFVLDGSTAEPTPVTSPPGVTNQLRPLGFVRRMIATQDNLYVAASKNGLVRFRRPAFTPGWTFSQAANAWAVEVAQADSAHDVILVGTNDQDSSGTLQLIWADPGSNTAPVFKDSRQFDRPVYALASHLDATTHMLTLLVGTACGSNGSPGITTGLWRFDFNLSSGPPSVIPQPSGTWRAYVEKNGALVPAPTFVRDIAIDAPAQVAYVACSALGVHKIDLASGGLSEVGGSGWPITSDAGGFERFVGVAVHRPTTSEALLAITLGPALQAERQVWGTCTNVDVCDDTRHPGDDSTKKGLQLWDVSGSPSKLGELTSLPPFPLKVSVRAETSDSFYLDIANAPHGLQVVQATRGGGGPWVLLKAGEWSQQDSVTTSSMDDVVQVANNLYGGNETSLAAWDATIPPGDPTLLHSTLAYAGTAAVLLSALSETSQYKTVIFGSAQGEGATFSVPGFDGSGHATSITSLGGMFADTREDPSPVRCISTFTLQPGQTPDPGGAPWLLLINNGDSDTHSGCNAHVSNGSLRLYRLVKDSHGVVQPMGQFAPVPLGSYIPKVCGSEWTGQQGTFVDAVMVPSGENQFAVWATYGPLNGETSAGLVVLSATYHLLTDTVDFTFVNKVVAFPNAADFDVGRITYPCGITGKALACFGCNGVAAFDVSSPMSVTVSSGNIWPGTSLGGCSLKASDLSPGGYFYVTFLNKGIGQFDPSVISSGPRLPLISTPFQPNAIIGAPSAITGKPAYFVADGAGGLHHLQIVQE